ncbi:MAG: adhesin [Cardiobacteriaceae bacterium]|nr:adhesin [Cardiobacteriaceae bacterium]
MKLWFPVTAAILALGVSVTASAAGGTVSYQCQSGKSVSVNYAFNSAGIPTSATAKINGTSRTMKYDLDRSDNTDTYFKDSNGYNLSASQMDSQNYRESSIMILSPKDEILYKDCSPSTKGSMKSENSKAAKSGSVSYMCQDNRRLKVNYVFNSAGVPVKAEANIKGKNRSMKYDLDRSDNTDTYFKDSSGFNISTSNMDSSNFREAPIMVFSPNDEILYKDCSPQ